MLYSVHNRLFSRFGFQYWFIIVLAASRKDDNSKGLPSNSRTVCSSFGSKTGMLPNACDVLSVFKLFTEFSKFQDMFSSEKILEISVSSIGLSTLSSLSEAGIRGDRYVQKLGKMEKLLQNR